MEAQKFIIDVADDMLRDLAHRLQQTRWADDFGNEEWQYGTNGRYLRELTEYWKTDYDWREQERQMNAYPHFRTSIDGVPIHYIHVRGNGPNAMPLMLNHGWPWTFWDLRKVISPLADPAAHGGDAADAFDVVVPSLPGYGFSNPLMKTGVNFWNTADLWVKLMEGLGYARFATQGGDWGAFVSAQLGHKHADRIIGVQITLPVPLDTFTAGMGVAPEDYAAEEIDWAQNMRTFMAAESGYMALQSTKPQTVAFALNDSPVGLASWILEKRRTWSDCGGNVEARFSKDDLLNTIMIYWVTQSYGTSARYYYEAAHRPWIASHDRRPVVEAPTSILMLEKEVVKLPRRWAERYYNLQRWTRRQSGGHFAPMEEPEAVIDEVRTFFRALRAS